MTSDNVKQFVLSHIKDREMLSSMARVSEEFKIYAHNTTRIGGQILITSNKESKILQIHVKNQKITHICTTEDSQPPPSPPFTRCSFSQRGRTFIGTSYGIYEYKFLNKIWPKLINTSDMNFALGSAACTIGNAILLQKWDDERGYLIRIQDNGSTYNSFECKINRPVSGLCWNTITNVQYNKVISIGGTNGIKVSSKVHEGKLSRNGKYVQWKQLPSMREPRSRHAALKLRNVLHVIGGRGGNGMLLKSSEMYNIDDERWMVGPQLPYHLYEMSAISDINERFLFILGWQKGNETTMKVILFYEENGFQEFTEIAMKKPFNGRLLALEIQ